MTFLTLLAENAREPCGRTCPVSANRKDTLVPFPTPIPLPLPTELCPEYCPGPIAPLPLPRNLDRSLCSQFWLWDLRATAPSIAPLRRAPQAGPIISLHPPTPPPAWPGLISVLSNEPGVLVTWIAFPWDPSQPFLSAWWGRPLGCQVPGVQGEALAHFRLAEPPCCAELCSRHRG